MDIPDLLVEDLEVCFVGEGPGRHVVTNCLIAGISCEVVDVLLDAPRLR